MIISEIGIHDVACGQSFLKSSEHNIMNLNAKHKAIYMWHFGPD